MRKVRGGRMRRMHNCASIGRGSRNMGYQDDEPILLGRKMRRVVKGLGLILPLAGRKRGKNVVA